MSKTSPVVVAMADEQARRDKVYPAQSLRLAKLVAEINRAMEIRDYARLVDLGNRLATDAIIAQALEGSDRKAREAL